MAAAAVLKHKQRLSVSHNIGRMGTMFMNNLCIRQRTDLSILLNNNVT
jgi:hypothetical protein